MTRTYDIFSEIIMDGLANPYQDEAEVLVRFPMPGQEHSDRDGWPWLAGVVVQQCGPDEWQIAVTDERAAELEDGEPAYPLVYRDGSEITQRAEA